MSFLKDFDEIISDSQSHIVYTDLMHYSPDPSSDFGIVMRLRGLRLWLAGIPNPNDKQKCYMDLVEYLLSGDAPE